jgi:hypothetical protein
MQMFEHAWKGLAVSSVLEKERNELAAKEVRKKDIKINMFLVCEDTREDSVNDGR